MWAIPSEKDAEYSSIPQATSFPLSLIHHLLVYYVLNFIILLVKSKVFNSSIKSYIVFLIYSYYTST